MSLYDSTGLYDQSALTFDGQNPGVPGLPNVGVFIAFNDSPYVADPSWTEVTQYVRDIPSIRRARSDDWSTFAGSASLTLSNRDQRFNPYNASGPYYGKLLPRRQIKIIAQVNGTNYPIFRGYIAGWPVEWSNNDEDSTVSIECFDALSLLADTNIPNDNSYAAIQTLNPIYWFRGNDADRSTTLPNIGSRSVSATGPFIGASPASSELALSKTLPVTKGIPFQSNVLYASTSYVTPSITGNSDTEISIAMWYSLVDNLNTYSTAVLRANLFAATAGAQIQTNGFIYAFSKRAGTLYETTSTIGGFANTDPHHVAVTCTGSTLKLYVDGRDVTGTVTSTFIGTTQAEQITIGSCAYQDCAVFNYALTATQVLSIYNAGNATIPETTSSRVQRITSSGLFPTALISTPASPQGTVSQISTGDAQLINEFDLVRNSEGGELYVSKDGVITFTERNSQLKGRSATTQAYFKDDGTALKYAGNFTLRYDADSVVNDLRYEITGDAFITATDATSVSAYGQASKNISTQLSTATDAQSLANSRLAIFDTPVPQVSPLEVGITRSASDWQNLLSLELLDQIEVTRTPKTGSVFSDRLLVNEITHSINPNEWSMQITGSARFSEWFTIDIDFINGDRLIA